MKGKTDSKQITTYLTAMGVIYHRLLKVSATDLRYIGEYENGYVKKQMSQLGCFTGGLFALTAMSVPKEILDEHTDNFDLDIVKMLAEEITQTCHESYTRNPTHLGPELFGFDSPLFGSNEPFAKVNNYALRPEVAESYFYMWRLTKNHMYRDWAWDMVEALNKHCRTEDGFTGLRDVTNTGSIRDDTQPSYFLAETLKYLYLIFSDDDVLPLEKFVFNTEGHPLLLKRTV
jgi:mannosyl-oligosaccharide alpha-1,2-mannosidase